MTDTNDLGKDVMYQVEYGSKLYGTSTPTSDTDLKTVYLPALDDVLLGKKMPAVKTRVDANGVKVPDDASMPDNGVENEYVPFQTFVRDFVRGQTYAVEVAYAALNKGPTAPDTVSYYEFQLLQELVEKFSNNDVYSMVGFAMKQTFDYVKRGERLNEALKVLHTLVAVQNIFSSTAVRVPRLDTPLDDMTVLDYVVAMTGLKTSVTVNNNKSMRTLELNGRSYLESTTVEHLVTLLKKLVDSYGDRTNAASKTEVDYKSLSHAVRVYQQALEVLDTGKLTFPRPNAEFLLKVKQGNLPLDEVKELLLALDAEVQEKLKTSTVRQRTPELEAEAERWLLSALRRLYLLY